VLNKGFIGPIGDDLPSLIPLLFGLVMFFSTFTLTFNAFDQRNVEFDNDIAVMRVSRILQSNSYLYSYDNFQELCDNIGVVNIKYIAFLSTDAVRRSDRDTLFEIEVFASEEDDDLMFFCTNLKEYENDDPMTLSSFITLENAQDERLVSRIFPIVVEDNKKVKPMHLFVVAWR